MVGHHVYRRPLAPLVQLHFPFPSRLVLAPTPRQPPFSSSWGTHCHYPWTKTAPAWTAST
ncbi:hypothetical protein CUMW_075770 [Citrus unshiu]|nr:hypothetical protein CUMW_075770 [Citrus unshiu]